MRIHFAILPLAFSTVWSLTGNPTCYFPDGNIAVNETACNSSAEHSACCQSQDLCLENKFCFSTRGRLVRSSCTDKSWNDSNCPYFCSDVNAPGSIVLYPVATSKHPISFCCGSGFSNETETCGVRTKYLGREPFNVPDNIPILNRTTGSTILTVTAITTAKATYSVKHDVLTGLGVGLPFLVALLASLGMLWKERRLRLSLAKDLDSKPPTTVLVSMQSQKMFEFDGVPHVRELPDSYLRELGEGAFEVI